MLSDDVEDLIGVSVAHVEGCKEWYAGICSVPATTKIFLAPYSAASLLEYDFNTAEMREIDISSICGRSHKRKYNGICACGTKVIAAPASSNHLLIYDVITEEVQGFDVTSLCTSTFSKFSGICAVGTKVFAAPSESSNMLMYDLETEKLSGIDISFQFPNGGDFLFAGICSVQSKVVAAPLKADVLLVFDVEDHEVHFVVDAVFSESSFGYLAICRVDSTSVLLAPLDAKSIVLYDVLTGQIKTTEVSPPISEGDDKFNGVFCDEETGLVVAVPKNRNQILIYETTTGDVRTVDISSHVTCDMKFSGVCYVGGQFFMAPHEADKMLIYRRKAFKLVLLDTTENHLLVCTDVTGQELLNVPLAQCCTLYDLRALLGESVGLAATLEFMRVGAVGIIHESGKTLIADIFDE